MPLYDFQCQECELVFEDQLPLEELDKEIWCPECEGETERLLVNPRHYKHLSWSTWNIGGGE
jgi:putative FmdB family regulatory protein